MSTIFAWVFWSFAAVCGVSAIIHACKRSVEAARIAIILMFAAFVAGYFGLLLFALST